MTNDEILQELSSKLSAGEMTRDEVMDCLDLGAVAVQVAGGEARGKQSVITRSLYALGGAIVIVGIGIFIAQIWDDIGSFERIAVTLGVGLLMAAGGSVFLKQRPRELIGPIFHFIGGLVIPGGAIVTLLEFREDVVTPWPVALTFGAIFAFYLLLGTVHRHFILTGFAIANGTAFLYLLVAAIVEGSLVTHDDLYAYLTMVTGLSYLLLAQGFRGGWNEKLIGTLYFLGITGFLGAAFSRVFDAVPWRWVYFVIIIGGLVFSVYVRRRSVLVMSTFFLIAHVSYITSEYFADSIGWPISLIMLGFVFLGLAYGSITINKRYIGASRTG